MENWNEHFYYDESSYTCLRRAKDWVSGMNYSIVKATKGDVAGSLSKGRHQSYAVKVNNISTRVHRIVWELHNGEIPNKMQIDHIDRNPLNNKISNLRLVDNKTNARNQSFRLTNTSGVCGVGLLKNKTKVGWNTYWKAQWNNLDGKRCAKCFSIDKYGNDLAFSMACAFREDIMKSLNESGAGYTLNHGIIST